MLNEHNHLQWSYERAASSREARGHVVNQQVHLAPEFEEPVN